MQIRGFGFPAVGVDFAYALNWLPQLSFVAFACQHVNWMFGSVSV